MPEPPSPERVAIIDTARQFWIRQLVDLSRRNNLLYFRDLQVGTLDLSNASPEEIQALLQSSGPDRHGVHLDDLVADMGRPQARAALTEIAKRARSNFEERGLDTLFLALGLATWSSHDGGRNPAAPVLLVPLEAKQAGGRSSPWILERSGDLKVNDVLAHALREKHGVTLDSEALVPEVMGDDEGEDFDLEPVFDSVRRCAAHIPGFQIERRWVVGNFAFQKMAIVKDLESLRDPLATHDIIAAIARAPGAEVTARGSRTPVDPGDFDRQSPRDEFLILDADSSQQQAITSTLRGQNGVISGPPGTGKSQTIANLIAELVARGKTVLFVAEKRAALDVVIGRLAKTDLAHLCLDCHGAELSRRHIAEQFRESLGRVREATLPDDEDLHQRFVDRRGRLNAHVSDIHAARQPWGISLYEIYGQLLELPEAAACQARLPKRVLTRIDRHALDSACEQIREMTTAAELFTDESRSAWVTASLTTPEQVRRAIDRARRLATEQWPRWEAALSALLSDCPAREPDTIADARQLLDTLSAIDETLDRAKDSLFKQDLSRLEHDLVPARSWLQTIWAMGFNARFRAAVRAVKEHTLDRRVSARTALALVERAQQQLDAWRKVAIDARTTLTRQPRLDELTAAWVAVLEDLEPLMRLFRQRSLNSSKLTDLKSWLSALAADTTSPARILQLHGIVDALKTQGLEPVLQVIRTTRPSSTVWPDVLRHVWLMSCIEEIQLRDPSIPNFSGRMHDQFVAEFRQMDRERLRVAIQRVQRAHAETALAARNRYPHEDSLVTREAHKRSKHLPLRKLLAEAPNVLVALRPCWMASPLSVSQLIPGDKPMFDVVIFDEASQVLPEDAITSLLRGRQAVVAGDQRQLPPTTFFAASDPGDDGADEGATTGFQSILDVMSSFLDPPWSLDWHYRSQDEALIAFSNHHIYGGRLVTFPGPGDAAAISHVLVPHTPGTDSQEASVAAEVRRVVQLVKEHAETRPGESLGVITMGVEHARRIDMALDRERQKDPALEALSSLGARESFFVKNLERVQGDERDAIILSIGYGKNNAGQLLYRFGPLLQEGGERRLNVAITRAKRRMTVVSSFSHHDMRIDYPRLGVKLLRGFLEYAASKGASLGQGTLTAVPLNPFEQSVFDELTRRGLRLHGQVGSSRYRIDMVAMHPNQPGRFVLAIECDGASYHSAQTARERDRLRQQQLEALGWHFHRIWSTDWFLRREEEVQRALNACAEAVRLCDTPHDQHQPSPPETHTPTPRTRVRRPSVASGRPPQEYSSLELQEMVRWVCSDGKLYTDDELLVEVAQALGKRRVASFVEVIRSAIREVRVGDPTPDSG